MPEAGQGAHDENVPANAPAWAASASRVEAALRGYAAILNAPGCVLFVSSLGFGALARDLDFTLGHAIFLALSVYALPTQVLMIDQIARGAALLSVAFAVTLTAIRLLPMTVSLMPFIRQSKPTARGWGLRILLAHVIATSVWVESMRRLPRLPERLRVPHMAGIGVAMLTATVGGSAVGYLVAGHVSPLVAAGLLFMNPIYFLFSLAAGSSTRMDWLALVFGALLGPLLFIWVPGFDLMLTGLVGGTLAYLIGRGRR
jgi:predicted branched-subunit amino acid permease